MLIGHNTCDEGMKVRHMLLMAACDLPQIPQCFTEKHEERLFPSQSFVCDPFFLCGA